MAKQRDNRILSTTNCKRGDQKLDRFVRRSQSSRIMLTNDHDNVDATLLDSRTTYCLPCVSIWRATVHDVGFQDAARFLANT